MAKKVSFRDIIKLQIAGLRQLDDQTLASLAPVMKLAEEGLRQELDKYSTDQFSYQSKLQTIQSINRSLAYLENKNEKILTQQAEFYNNFGVKNAQNEISQMNKASAIITPSLDKDAVSLEHNGFLINNAVASLRMYNAEIRSNVSNAITQGQIMKKTGYEIVGRVSKFLQIKRYRIERIVRTELHKIYNTSKLLSYGQYKKQYFPNLKKRLIHPIDNRTGDDSIQLRDKDPRVDLDKPFVFKYRRVLKNGTVRITKRIFMAPPDRPNDRAIMVSYRDEWKND